MNNSLAARAQALAAFQQQFQLQPAAHIDGCLFAVAACPEIPLPDKWLPWSFAHIDHQVLALRDFEALTQALIEHLQLHLSAMRAEHSSFPAELASAAASPAQLSLWCRGFLFAHQQLEGIWQQAWNNLSATDAQDARQRLRRCLAMLSTFADVPLALKQAEEKGNGGLAQKLPELQTMLPKVLQDYVVLAGELAQQLDNQFETFHAPEKPASSH